MKTKLDDEPVVSPINFERIRINRAFSSMRYCASLFLFADPTKESEFEFTKRVANNCEKLVDLLKQLSETDNVKTVELLKLQTQRAAIRDFLGLINGFEIDPPIGFIQKVGRGETAKFNLDK